MTEITNYNCHKECADICSEEYCDELAELIFPYYVDEKKFLIPCCKKHFYYILNNKMIHSEELSQDV